ncbi:DUF1707 SHOCT-like domain-containing protein [Rhodococcus sp. SJ-3]|uniref:DUF1707 SHOCT-like domain-containing protein n=1 Tax=Rhodococcus sp. SJ-3 TaxID=3454628 RepID=UPI003F7902CB
MTDRPDEHDLRLSDDERLHSLNVISEHFAAGRLDADEFYERSGEIAAARALDPLRNAFRGLPGGAPLEVVDNRIRKVSTEIAETTPVGTPSRSAETELSSLLRRGNLVESLDWVIIGITLVTFLVLNNVFDWDHAWLVWPSLVVTLGLPRLIFNYSDSDEELYEELKESENEERKKRLKQAADRIKQLESNDRDT